MSGTGDPFHARRPCVAAQVRVRPSYMESAATAAAAPHPDPQAPFDDLLPLVRDEGIADSVRERLVSEVVRARTVLCLARGQASGALPAAGALLHALLRRGGSPSPPPPRRSSPAVAPSPKHPRRLYGDQNREWSIQFRPAGRTDDDDSRRRAARGERRRVARAAAAAAAAEDDDGPGVVAPSAGVIDWSEEIERAMEHRDGLLGVWRTEVLPKLGVNVNVERGTLQRPRPGNEARQTGRHRLASLAAQFRRAHEEDQVPLRPGDVRLLEAIEGRGIEAALQSSSHLLPPPCEHHHDGAPQ